MKVQSLCKKCRMHSQNEKLRPSRSKKRNFRLECHGRLIETKKGNWEKISAILQPNVSLNLPKIETECLIVLACLC